LAVVFLHRGNWWVSGAHHGRLGNLQCSAAITTTNLLCFDCGSRKTGTFIMIKPIKLSKRNAPQKRREFSIHAEQMMMFDETRSLLSVRSPQSIESSRTNRSSKSSYQCLGTGQQQKNNVNLPEKVTAATSKQREPRERFYSIRHGTTPSQFSSHTNAYKRQLSQWCAT
jgi:hypothetical protein